MPLNIDTVPLDLERTSVPRLVQHDWLRSGDRRSVVEKLGEQFGLDCRFVEHGAAHAREINLRYVDGRIARIYLDQGFGFWKPTGQDRFDFSASPSQQVRQLLALPIMVRGSGKTYFAALALPSTS